MLLFIYLGTAFIYETYSPLIEVHGLTMAFESLRNAALNE
jgi:hypothetical protein